MGEERDDDDVYVTYAGGDGICSVQERDARQRAHGHGYSYAFVTVNNNVNRHEGINYGRVFSDYNNIARRCNQAHCNFKTSGVLFSLDLSSADT